jgi:hypothetical protein
LSQLWRFAATGCAKLLKHLTVGGQGARFCVTAFLRDDLSRDAKKFRTKGLPSVRTRLTMSSVPGAF